jgi:branched-chain amino acid transport system substrate-binding protein
MPVPTNPKITQLGHKNLFRIPVTDDRQGSACVDFMLKRLKKSKIAIVHNKQAYGEGIAVEVRKSLKNNGTEPLSFIGLDADDKDYRPVISKLKGLDPDAVFFGGDHVEAALLIKQARELGLDVPFVMGDGCFNSQLITIAGKAAEGCYVSNISPTNAPSARAKAFYEKFEAKHGKIVAFAPLGYVAATLLLDAIEKTKKLTRSNVLKVLRTPSFSFDSIFGAYRFKTNGDSGSERVFMHVVRSGKFETVAE